MEPVTVGLDIGSVGVKAVLMKGGRIISTVLAPTGWSPGESGEKAVRQLLGAAGISPDDVKASVATGYGTVNSFAQKTFTNISYLNCHSIACFSVTTVYHCLQHN